MNFIWFVLCLIALLHLDVLLLCSDERRLIERFQNSEKFYIQLLKNAATTYLHDLSDDLRATLTVFLETFNKIVKFHADTFYPKLLQCEMKIITICDMIKTHLDHYEFNIYFTYAAYVHEALHMIQNFYLTAVRHFNCKFHASIAFIVAFCSYLLVWNGLIYNSHFMGTLGLVSFLGYSGDGDTQCFYSFYIHLV